LVYQGLKNEVLLRINQQWSKYMSNQSNKSQNQTSDELESRLKKWMSLDQVNIKRFGSERLAKVKLEVMSFGKEKVIESRIPELSRESKKRPSSAIKLSTKIATAIIGSIVFGSAMRVFSSNLGGIALPAAYLGGAGLGYCVDFLATTASTNYSRLQYTRSCFEKISTARKRELAQGGNELVAAFYEGQIRTIQSIEGNVFNKQFPIHLTLATIISILEYCASFWIISSQTGSSDSQNTVIQTFIAGLPVAMTWLIAYVKSQTFGIPEYAFELLQSYRSSNLIHWDKPTEEIQALTEQQFFNVATLDAGIASLLDTNPQPKYFTPREAELDFSVRHYNEKIEILESEYATKIDNIEKQFSDEIANLPDLFSPQEVDMGDFTNIAIAKQHEKNKQAKKIWIDENMGEIQKKKEEKIKQFEDKYLAEKQQLLKKHEAAKSEYELIHSEALINFGVA
jgi:hypothetical protein